MELPFGQSQLFEYLWQVCSLGWTHHDGLNWFVVYPFWNLKISLMGITMLIFEPEVIFFKTKSMYYEEMGGWGGAQGRFDWGAKDIIHSELKTNLGSKLQV